MERIGNRTNMVQTFCYNNQTWKTSTDPWSMKKLCMWNILVNHDRNLQYKKRLIYDALSYRGLPTHGMSFNIFYMQPQLLWNAKTYKIKQI